MPVSRSSFAPRSRTFAGLASLLLFAQCATSPTPDDDAGDFFVVAGEKVHIGTRVVTFLEPDGYSAYREGKHFDRTEQPDGERRYSERKQLPEHLADHAATLNRDELAEVVHQFVVHYDVCGTSRRCFQVLQDARKLSVHFLLDVDGTIYQTLDLREKAWHATIANNHAVGVEIAHPGAWPQPLNADMRRWYEQDQWGWRMKLPGWMKQTGIRTEGFVARPDRPSFVSGPIQGRTMHQFDFTPEQYAALPKLIAGLNRALPRIRLEAPRGEHGRVVDHALPADELHAFDGVVGHLHVQKNKPDPGPAFQWDRVLGEARAIRARGED